MTRYWCHICNSFVHVDEETRKCITCGEDFIEVVQEETPPPEPQVPQNPPPAANFQQIPMDPNNPLTQMFRMISDMMGNAGGNPAAPQPGQGANGVPPVFMFPRQGPMFQPNQAVPNGPMGPQMQMPFGNMGQFPMGPVFNFTTHGGSIQELLQGLMGPQQMGDYVSDAGMASLLDRLFRQHQSSQVPAGKKVLDELPTVKFTEETATGECAICKCDWAVDEEAVDLPCHHLFHKDCIKKWFETSNLCPMCRYELPTDDPEYETKRKEKEQLRNSQKSSNAASSQSTPSFSSSTPDSTSSASNSAPSAPHTPTQPSTANRNSPSTIDLTQSQEDLLESAILIASDSDSSFSPSMDVDSDYETAESESYSEEPSTGQRRAPGNNQPNHDQFDVD